MQWLWTLAGSCGRVKRNPLEALYFPARSLQGRA
jgi:hypothetical protein